MKGLDSTISLVIVIVVAIAAVFIVSVILDGNLTSLEGFYEGLNWRPDE